MRDQSSTRMQRMENETSIAVVLEAYVQTLHYHWTSVIESERAEQVKHWHIWKQSALSLRWNHEAFDQVLIIGVT